LAQRPRPACAALSFIPVIASTAVLVSAEHCIGPIGTFVRKAMLTTQRATMVVSTRSLMWRPVTGPDTMRSMCAECLAPAWLT
jgi:hypothetical protein